MIGVSIDYLACCSRAAAASDISRSWGPRDGIGSFRRHVSGHRELPPLSPCLAPPDSLDLTPDRGGGCAKEGPSTMLGPLVSFYRRDCGC
jgi:hypothetical protein